MMSGRQTPNLGPAHLDRVQQEVRETFGGKWMRGRSQITEISFSPLRSERLSRTGDFAVRCFAGLLLRLRS